MNKLIDRIVNSSTKLMLNKQNFHSTGIKFAPAQRITPLQTGVVGFVLGATSVLLLQNKNKSNVSEPTVEPSPVVDDHYDRRPFVK